MAQQFSTLANTHIEFIGEQHIFFVGTAAPTGRVNISPKGMDSLRVLNNQEIAYLDVTGSSAETAAHLIASPDSRLTLMFCAFAAAPRILRVYGRGTSFIAGSAKFKALADRFPPLPGARQIIHLAIDLVQTSCGMGVPRFDYMEERTALNAWAEKLGPSGIDDYRRRKNARSLDGFTTGLVDGDEPATK